MIKRTASATIARYASSYPAVTILGPRQAGKSTLVKAMFPSYSSANPEFTEVRELAASDTTAFFSMYPPPVIIDEVQVVPGILSHEQALIDEYRKANGRNKLNR